MDDVIAHKHLLVWMGADKWFDLMGVSIDGRHQGKNFMVGATVEAETPSVGWWVSVFAIRDEDGNDIMPEQQAKSWTLIPWDCLRAARLYDKRPDLKDVGFRQRG
jgi:hypothetical protein